MERLKNCLVTRRLIEDFIVLRFYGMKFFVKSLNFCKKIKLVLCYLISWKYKVLIQRLCFKNIIFKIYLVKIYKNLKLKLVNLSTKLK